MPDPNQAADQAKPTLRPSMQQAAKLPSAHAVVSAAAAAAQKAGDAAEHARLFNIEVAIGALRHSLDAAGKCKDDSVRAALGRLRAAL